LSTGYKISDGQALYFLTFQIVGWVDTFTRRIYRDIVIDSFRYCQNNKGLNFFAYVIHNNPVKAGIATRPEDYLYSSARNWAELDNVLDVIKLDLTWKTV
jgi:hypothetical protein